MIEPGPDGFNPEIHRCRHLLFQSTAGNAEDRREAANLGKNPGGDIFIHGQGRFGRGKGRTDWTWGCIAVTDEEIREIFSLVDVGTKITINP